MNKKFLIIIIILLLLFITFYLIFNYSIDKIIGYLEVTVYDDNNIEVNKIKDIVDFPKEYHIKKMIYNQSFPEGYNLKIIAYDENNNIKELSYLGAEAYSEDKSYLEYFFSIYGKSPIKLYIYKYIIIINIIVIFLLIIFYLKSNKKH